MTGYQPIGWINKFSWLVQAMLVSVMALLLPASPFACAVLSGRIGFLRQYGDSIKRSAKSLRALYRADVIARNLERLLQRWLGLQLPAQHVVQGSCTHCGKCCLDSSCVFLQWAEGGPGSGQSRCSIHNNWFWKLTSCGSYPIDAPSIAVYDCQSFKAIPVRVLRIESAPRACSR